MDPVFKLITLIIQLLSVKHRLDRAQGARLISLFQCQEMTIKKAGNNFMCTFLGDVQ